MTQTPFYSLKSPRQKWDVIVIGSGMGGMTAAAMLARAGKKVLVLEQHYIPGGFTHAFKRDNWEWDVGVHAIGEVTGRSLVGRVLKSLTGDRLKWASLGPVYEQFFFPDGFRIDFPDNPKAFARDLKAKFPGEERAIDEYFRQIKAVGRGMRHHFLGRTMPRQLGSLYERLTGSARLVEATTASVLDKLTDNERLKTVLAAQWGYYGATPKRSAFAIQALVARHFAYGGYYPVGGASRIAAGLLQTVADAGGWTRVRAPVKQINVVDGKAVGVTLQKGEVIEAERVVSAAGAHATSARLLPDDAAGAKEWAARLSSLKPTPCHICLHVGFEGDIRTAGATSANQWMWTTWDCEDQIWDFTATDEPPRILYTSYPSLKDPEHTSPYHTAEIVTFVPYELFARWVGSRTQGRGEDYEKIKADVSRRVLEHLLRYMPKLAPMVRYTELSTPLSTEHYTRAQLGAIYGLEPTPARFGNPWLRPRTPIKGLFLAGSDVGSAGVIGAMVGGALAAVAMEPWKTLALLRSEKKAAERPVAAPGVVPVTT